MKLFAAAPSRLIAAAVIAVSCAHAMAQIEGRPAGTSLWTNSLGMVFVPLSNTNVCFCIWETRVGDFTKFAATHPKLDGTNWNHAFYHDKTPVSVGPNYPVVNVSWNDAKSFCGWLTEKERASGAISSESAYRLPTDEEWSLAVGIGGLESGGTPKEKSARLQNIYPWGTNFPPLSGTGNFADQSAFNYFTNWPHIPGYTDGFVTTSPVGSFKPDQSGIYDLAGNAMEWCEDLYDAAHKHRVLRGGAWINCGPNSLLSSSREHALPERFSVATGFRCVLAPKP